MRGKIDSLEAFFIVHSCVEEDNESISLMNYLDWRGTYDNKYISSSKLERLSLSKAKEAFDKGDKDEADKIINDNHTRKAKNCGKFMKTFVEAAKDEEDKIYFIDKYKNVEYTGFDEVYKYSEVEQKMSSDDDNISKKKTKRKSTKIIG